MCVYHCTSNRETGSFSGRWGFLYSHNSSCFRVHWNGWANSSALNKKSCNIATGLGGVHMVISLADNGEGDSDCYFHNQWRSNVEFF